MSNTHCFRSWYDSGFYWVGVLWGAKYAFDSLKIRLSRSPPPITGSNIWKTNEKPNKLKNWTICQKQVQAKIEKGPPLSKTLIRRSRHDRGDLFSLFNAVIWISVDSYCKSAIAHKTPVIRSTTWNGIQKSLSFTSNSLLHSWRPRSDRWYTMVIWVDIHCQKSDLGAKKTLKSQIETEKS
jgi:hypothetical protein